MEIPSIAMRVPAMSTPGIGNTPGATGPTGTTGTGAASAAGGFGQALTTAISGLNETQSAADNASVRMAAGDPIDLHEVMLARETASLHFQLAVQVRNKLVEAYQDVMRMQV
jgi:flagellar hook-basal body complex protein FliE